LNKHARLTGLAVAITTLALSANVEAQNAFNDFGPGQSFNQDASWAVTGSLYGDYTFAPEFTSAASGSLYNIIVAIGSYVPSIVNLTLFADNGGTPGTVMETWTGVSLPSSLDITPVVFTNAVSGVSLVAGQNYWLAFTAGTPRTQEGWRVNSIGLNGPLSFSTDGGMTWPPALPAILPAFSVEVTPEPVPMAVLGLGVVPLILLRRRTPRK
jgi:hypothetical protein